MAWITPTTRATGALITAAIWNSDVVDNPIALRAGAVAITDQANGRVIVATSTTQLSARKNSFIKAFLEVYG